KGARPSPRLFAACHVLHRLSVPRHPPNALTRLIRSFAATHSEQNPPRSSHKASTRHSALHVTRLAIEPMIPSAPGLPKRQAIIARGQSHSSPQCQRSEVRRQKSEVRGKPSGPSDPVSTCFPSLGCRPAPGGADRDRTGDPLLAKQVLSQLSYGPKLWWARED